MGEFVVGGISIDVGTYGASIDSYIQAAERANINAEKVEEPIAVDVTVLPQNLQDELTGCDNNDSCKYVAYNFDSQAVIPRVQSNIDYTIDLFPHPRPNDGVFLKNTVDVVDFLSIPTYDVSFTDFIGTPLKSINNSVTPVPELCAEECDKLDNCEGFNYSALRNTCDIFPTGSERGNYGFGASFSKLKRGIDPESSVPSTYWKYIPGDSALNPTIYTCSFSTTTQGCTVFNRTSDGNLITRAQLPPFWTFWNVSKKRIDKCNNAISNLVHTSNTVSFTTDNMYECKGLPPRTLLRNNTVYRLYDEEGGYRDLNSNQRLHEYIPFKDSLYDLLHYSAEVYYDPSIISAYTYGLQCAPGQYIMYFGCRSCPVTLLNNSYWIPNRKCEQYTCPLGTYVDYGVEHYHYQATGGIPYYCAQSPNGSFVYIDPSGNGSLRACTNPLNPGYMYDSEGFSSTSPNPTCPTKYCMNPLYDREVYTSSCSKRECDYGSYRGLDRQCNPCTVSRGPRDFFMSPRTCEICSVPIGFDRVPASGQYTYYADGTRYPSTIFSPGMTGYPEYGCKTTQCPRTPNAYEIWDVNSSNLCAIIQCAANELPNATKTACVRIPGFSSLCEMDNDCICDLGTKKQGNSCVECSEPLPGRDYLDYNTLCLSQLCSSKGVTRASYEVWATKCAKRKCFASTTPDTGTDPTSCVRCPTEPYNVGTTRYGYISNVTGGGIYGAFADPVIGGNFLTGCTLGVCPVPTGLYRWKYGVGCDFILCPRAPSGPPTASTAGERWAGDFGCDIVTYSYAIGQTTCTTFPSAGNKWTNSYGCEISACRRMTNLGCDSGWTEFTGPDLISPYFPDEENKYCRMVKPAAGCPSGSTNLSGTNYCYKSLNTTPFLTNGDIWGPGCTKRSLVALDDVPNSSNTYFIKCTNWPGPSQRFGTQPCSIEPCNFSPLRGYIWDYTKGGECQTTQCPAYTFPNSNASKCIPCPTDKIGNNQSRNYGLYNWRKQSIPDINNMCRVEGCAEITGQTPSTNQYFTPACVINACPLGSNVVNQWTCTTCDPMTIDVNDIWTTPGKCWSSPCGNQQANASRTACQACSITPGYGFTFGKACTLTQCPAIVSSNIWTTMGSCNSTMCTGRTQPNTAKSACEVCPNPPYGNQFSGTDGCSYTACQPPIASSNIWISLNSCESSKCTGHTQPNSTKTACEACPITPTLGNTWSSTDGCAISACPAIASSNIYTTVGSCANTKCPGHTQPNATKSVCVACPVPTLGNTWSSTDGCAISACPAIASSNIYTTIGSCANSACANRTRPTTDKTACEACPITLGNTWSSTDGCAISACPAIASSNIWTTIGSCINSICAGRTRPSADKSACEACPAPTMGNTWTSTDGCAFQACPNITPGTQYATAGSCTTIACPSPPSNGTWDPADTRGQCNLICTVLPGQQIEDPRTCSIQTWVSVDVMPARPISVLTAPNYAYLPDFDRPTHRIRHSPGTSFGFDTSKISASWVTGYVRFESYYFRITIGFDEQITTTKYNSDIEIYGYFVDKNGTQLVSPTINWVNGTSAVLSFGNITQFACDPPAPGFQWNPDGGCSTVPCTITPARGSMFDPGGGCRVYSCTTDLGITPGYNQFFTGVGCLTESCPVATILDTATMTCNPIVCNPSGISMPSDSIYEVIVTSVTIPTCPPFELVEGDQWSNDCGLTDLKPGSVYNFSTCIKNTQMYTGVCEEYYLPTWKEMPDGTFEPDQFSKECQLYATKGSHILAGPSLPNGYHYDDYLQLRLKNPNGVIVQSDLPSGRNGMIDYVVPADGTYTVIQSCGDGQCDGRIGYSGAVTASNFPSPNIETVSLLRDASGQEIMNSTYQNYPCPSGPSFYTGHSIDVSIPLDSTGPFILEQSCGTKACTGQTTITPVSTPSCAVRQCTGRTQPDATKTLCEGCPTTTLTPGTTWASTNGCQTTACTPAPTYGNTWVSTDTTGQCARTACSPALASDSIWSGPSCARTQCAAGTTPAANKLSCTACTGLASSNIWTTMGSCANSKCTGRQQPDASKTACVTCTSPPLPGYTWSATDGCATQACATTPVYGNVWDSTDTNGACRQIQCPSSETNLIIPGKYIGTSSCTSRVTCPGTLTAGNGWDPTYDTFATCRQAPLVFNTRSTFSVTGFPANFPYIKDASSTYGTLAFSTSTATGATAFTSTGTSSPALQTGYTHIKFRQRGTADTTANTRYFKITSNYTLGDNLIYGYLVDPVTNLQVSKWFSATSQGLESPVYFGTMCPGPFTAGAGGQYFSNATTCKLTTCSTLVSYGQTYTNPGLTCDVTQCTTAVNKYYATTGTCTTLSCPLVEQGKMYSSTRTNLNTCPTVVACPTALAGLNGWVTDLTGLGTCAQKVLTWSQTVQVTTSVKLKLGPATPTSSDPLRTAYIYHPTAGTILSSWGTGIPTSGYTHIRFILILQTGQTLTFQVSTPVTASDTAIYGFFVDSSYVDSTRNNRNIRYTAYPNGYGGIAISTTTFNDYTITFGNYS